MKQDADNDDIQSLLEGDHDLLNQGVSIHDADGKLVVCNQVLIDLFAIPEELTRPGTHVTEMLRHFAERGNFDPGDIDDLVRGRLANIANRDIYFFRQILPDGRIIQYNQSFLPDGGFATVYTDVTERSRTEERLRRQAIVIEQMEEAVIITGLDRLVIDVNAAGERLTGFTRKEILGHVPEELFSLNIPLQEIIEEADEKGSWRGELELKRRDGTVRQVETVIVVLRDEQQVPVARVAVSRDITERKNAEIALRQSEAKFRNLIESSIQGVLIHESLKVVYANRALGEILGYDPVDLIGMSVIDMVAPEDRELVRSFQKTGQTGTTQIRGIRGDGTIIWTESISRPIEWDGRPARQITMVDISQRKRAEEDLRRQTVVMDQIQEAVLITDRDRRVIYMNPGVESLFGFSRDEVFGKVPSEVFSTTLPIEDMLGTIRREEVWRGEIEYVRRDGAKGNAETVIQPLRDEHGAFIGRVGVSRDITVRKKAEQALLKAREVAERANDAKTRFLAAASHDLRQPVQALRLLTEALAKENDRKTFVEIVGEIQTCTEAMDGLLNAVLDISKLEAGVVKTEPEVFPIGQVLTSLVDEFSPLAGDKGLGLCSVLSTAFVRTDPVLLQRILRNFISNAIQCTKVGRVLVGCRRSGGTLRLEVWDTGIGIPESETERIFEEFHQLGNPERNTEKGLGLGLAIAKGTGELLNLPITVRSTVGKGSVFSVAVPLVTGEFAKREDEDTPAGRAVAANDAFVLLVENEPVVARAVERILKLWGYRVLAFQNVNEAIDAAGKFETSPDAIIADYSLSPEVTGGELIKLLEQKFRSNIAGIILTGDTSPERLREAEAHGYHLLHKPASPQQLRAALERVLS